MLDDTKSFNPNFTSRRGHHPSTPPGLTLVEFFGPLFWTDTYLTKNFVEEKKFVSKSFAKLSPSPSWSWAEISLIPSISHPPTQPPNHLTGIVLREHSSITSATFPRFWTPHPPLRQQYQHKPWPPNPPLICWRNTWTEGELLDDFTICFKLSKYTFLLL